VDIRQPPALPLVEQGKAAASFTHKNTVGFGVPCAIVIDRLPLSRRESPTHVPLAQRAPSAQAEHFVIVLGKS
jgi:hypothetical protein